MKVKPALCLNLSTMGPLVFIAGHLNVRVRRKSAVFYQSHLHLQSLHGNRKMMMRLTKMYVNEFVYEWYRIASIKFRWKQKWNLLDIDKIKNDWKNNVNVTGKNNVNVTCHRNVIFVVKPHLHWLFLSKRRECFLVKIRMSFGHYYFSSRFWLY